MKKLTLVIALLLSISYTTKAQDTSKSIEIKKVFGGNTYMQDGKRLTMSQLSSLMENNQKALPSLKKAKSNLTWGTIFGVAGGGLVGFPLGTAIGGGDAKWELAGIGAGLILIGIPFNSAYNKHSKNAVDEYNNTISSNAYRFNPSFKLDIKGNSLGITMNF